MFSVVLDAVDVQRAIPELFEQLDPRRRNEPAFVIPCWSEAEESGVRRWLRRKGVAVAGEMQRSDRREAA